MNRTEFAAGWTMLESVYGEQPADTKTLYARLLKDMDGALWQEVCGHVIIESKWFPKPSEIIDSALRLSELPSLDSQHDAAHAFDLALRAVRRYTPDHHQSLPDVPDDVVVIVRALGGWYRLALVETEDLNWYRKEFIALHQQRYQAHDTRGMIVRGELSARRSTPALPGPGANPAREIEP